MVDFVLIMCLFPCLHLLSFSRCSFPGKCPENVPALHTYGRLALSCTVAVTCVPLQSTSAIFLPVQLQFHPPGKGHFGNEVSTGFF